MNYIKTLLVALFLIGSLAITAQNTITATEAHFSITHETTREQLVQLRTDLKAQGFDFRYIPSFDNHRQLTTLSFTITANDGALQGSGEHVALANPAAVMTIHMNKTAATFSVDKAGE